MLDNPPSAVMSTGWGRRPVLSCSKEARVARADSRRASCAEGRALLRSIRRRRSTQLPLPMTAVMKTFVFCRRYRPFAGDNRTADREADEPLRQAAFPLPGPTGYGLFLQTRGLGRAGALADPEEAGRANQDRRGDTGLPVPRRRTDRGRPMLRTTRCCTDRLWLLRKARSDPGWNPVRNSKTPGRAI